MPYKILTLFIFTIIFPTLIAGSTVLLLKSGLVETGKPRVAMETAAASSSTELTLSKVSQINQQKNVKQDTNYEIPQCGLKLIIQESSQIESTNNTDVVLISVKEKPQNSFVIYNCYKIKSGEKLKKDGDKGFSYQKINNLQEFEDSLPPTKKPFWTSKFFENIQEMNYLQSIPGVSSPIILKWDFISKTGYLYSLSFTSYPSEYDEFAIFDIEFQGTGSQLIQKTREKNSSDESQKYIFELKGNCGAYVEKNDSNEFILADLKTRKILYNFDKEFGEVSYLNTAFKHSGKLIVLGKQKSNVLYVLDYFPDADSRFILTSDGNMGTMGFTLNVNSFNSETKKMNSIKENQKIYLSGVDESIEKCKDPYQESRYSKACYPDISKDIIDELKYFNLSFKKTELEYGVPNFSFRTMKF